jgi:hypothetical protein
MSFIKNIIAVLILISMVTNVNAEEAADSTPKAKLRGPAEFQKVIDDYKAYVAKIPPAIREEIIEYRKSVAKLNKQKRLIYRQLSQDSQNYLKKEQQYKKKLPLQRKSLINIEDPGNTPKKPVDKK